MDLQAILIMAAIGVIAGFLASLVAGGSGGLLFYLIVGLLGAFVGGILFSVTGISLGIANALFSQIVTSTIGAIIVIVVARLVI